MSDYREVGSVGIMEGAFFVSRKELIDWVNKSLKLNITKIEQCSNGAIYIQLLDILFPTKSVLNKAKWLAKMEYECIMNYKLIQSVFSKIGIKKQMDVDKLIKGKYQDNLEFLQWFKAFYERIIDYNSESVTNYDPIERRKISILGEKGDYRLLNTYLPDWAKVDLSYFKDRGGTYNETKGTTGTVGGGGGAGGVHTQKRSLSRHSANMDTNFLSSSRISSGGNPHMNNLNSSSRRGRNGKGTYHGNNKELHATKKMTSNLGTRISVSNKYSSRDSVSSNIQRSNNTNDSNAELAKDTNISSEPYRKLKLQLENKNQEIQHLKNKLKEEKNEKKLANFQKEFYYNKLRFLELLCNQTEENYLLISDIQQIIYARENTYFHQTVSLNDKTAELNESHSGQELPLEMDHTSYVDQNEYDPVEYASAEEQYNNHREPRYAESELNGEINVEKQYHTSEVYQLNVERDHGNAIEKNIDYGSNCT